MPLLTVKLTDEEMQAIQDAAKASGLSMSEMVRRAFIPGYTTDAVRDDDLEALRQRIRARDRHARAILAKVNRGRTEK